MATTRQQLVTRAGPGGLHRQPDELVVEEPLEVVVAGSDGTDLMGVTMRTPGHDLELVAGLLVGEGVIAHPADLGRLTYACGHVGRTVVATVRVPVWAGRRARATVTSSACGVCGTLDTAGLVGLGAPVPRAVGGEVSGGPATFSASAGPAEPLPLAAEDSLDARWLAALPERLAEHQRAFQRTGALHGAGLVQVDGPVVAVREDVGRHNAVDKVVGWAFLQGRTWPLAGHVLVVSGRVSYEIVVKAWRAGIPAVVAVSAASTAAVDVAARAGVTVAGFVRDGQLVCYAGADRLLSSEAPARD